MDPYIEACHLWDDFHHNLISGIQHAVARVLPARYVVRAGERSYITLTAKEGAEEYRVQADVTIARKPYAGTRAAQSSAAALLEATEPEASPITMRALVHTEFREGFLEIREAHGDRQVVTSIEVLSPSNKHFRSKGWVQYLRKRRACLDGLVNFVEIDLLRRGRRMPMEDPWPDSPYYLLVSRQAEAPRCSVWRAYSTRPLSEIPVPLAPPDGDVPLSLQPLIDAIYERSQYAVDIDYRQPLDPPLIAADAAWLEQSLRQRQERSNPAP
jgi:hypothetical protein